MVNVTGVKFRNAGKVYYFDPSDVSGLELGMGVIVETARGQEYGMVSMLPTDVSESAVVRPLRKVVRIATEEDIKRKEENESRREETMRICQEKIDKHELDMKLIDVEYTFDNNKMVFYFTADGRVDFRELVKDLAGVFRTRIELRQVGVRDEAKMLGGCGPCGKGLCCATWMNEFQPVSIKMAKLQNLSLNPTKISGICGRLMCCLKYENDVYLELRKGMPENGERIDTPDGQGKVIDSNILCGKIRARLFTGEKEEDGSEKLSDDIYTYEKKDVRRLNPKKNRADEKKGKNGKGSDFRAERDEDILAEVDEEYKAELAALLDD